ncbi:solute carrier organic anion transporter family member 2B1-like [Xyrauchen texanus]|uniref:solute carrier organic anion transporter family member 2B1-like n=1 Tax=Xyrauchen texanus TaxID=154827 RepID=UPI002242C5AA|nr:solute carrier organic anion transporter family member 2B1-like [Xyrauchen texanus]XP_051960270.1 solute carrier organic anion transporter family member 2B1-like [Xyrauchen texanus]
MGLFNNIKFFVLCHGMLQLAQLLVSGYLKGSITTIEKRYGFSSQKSGLLAAFNEVGNTVLIVFVSFFGSRVHRPRCIGIGALIASVGVFLIALPHFISTKYDYTGSNDNTKANRSGLCQSESNFQRKMEVSNQICNEEKTNAHLWVYPILLLGQLLFGIGGVPIQPFGISYIDDYAKKRNSPFYLGILFAVTVIGPAFGYMMASLLLSYYVDIDKMSFDKIYLKKDDPRWVGAWWLGFIVAGTLLFLTSLPYLFFPRKMFKEEIAEVPVEQSSEKMLEKTPKTDAEPEVSLNQFLKSFPKIVMRTLRNPIYLLVVLAQVNLAAMVAGLATFMAKFIERQFTQTAAFSTMMIGGLNIPSAMLGIMAGGVIMRRLSLSVRSSAAMCTLAVLISIFFAIPLLFLGCPTQSISGINYAGNGTQQCTNSCHCSNEAFNPVCGSDGVEFQSPCHAGCITEIYSKGKVLNYTNCDCVSSRGSPGFALPGKCRSSCANHLIPFMILSSITCFVASLSHTTSFMMILRTVTPEDKSFALGIQFMLFRVLAFLPAPVLYGRAIDSTCIEWGKKCGKDTSCSYYNLDHFRHRFLGLQIFFIFGGFVCFLLSFLVLRKINSTKQLNEQMKSQTKSESIPEMKDAKQSFGNSD